jgi:hypothetical protein
MALEYPVAEVKALATHRARWQAAGKFEAELSQREQTVSRLGQIEDNVVPLVAPLQGHRAKLKMLGHWLASIARLKETFTKATKLQGTTLPPIDGLKALANRVDRMKGLATQYERLESDIERAEGQLLDCLAEAQTVLSEFDELGLCPTCHQGITAEHVVACPA